MNAPIVRTFDEKKIMASLAGNDEAIQFINAHKKALKQQQELTAKAISKLQTSTDESIRKFIAHVLCMPKNAEEAVAPYTCVGCALFKNVIPLRERILCEDCLRLKGRKDNYKKE